MKQTYGNLSRVFREEKPAIYDRQTHIINFDFQETEQQQATSGEANDGATKTKGAKATNTTETTTTTKGWSGFTVQSDGIINYGHIKSQLIEAAYPQKDEFAIAFNMIPVLQAQLAGKELTDDQQADLEKYNDFMELRNLAANTAKEVVDSFKA